MHISNSTFQNGAEQWYAIDDVVVSDSPIPLNYVIDGGMKDQGDSTTVAVGDLNGDGQVNTADAQLALDISVGKVPVTADNLARGDVAPLVDGKSRPDGKIDANDAIVNLPKLLVNSFFNCGEEDNDNM